MPWQPMHMAVLLRWARSASPGGAFCCAIAAGVKSAIRLPAMKMRAMRMRSGIRFFLAKVGNVEARDSSGKRLLESNFASRKGEMRFKGSASYVSTDDLTLAVNAAITLQRPLLVKG